MRVVASFYLVVENCWGGVYSVYGVCGGGLALLFLLDLFSHIWPLCY